MESFFFSQRDAWPPPLAAKFHYNSKAAHSCFQTRAIHERATTEKENGLLPFFTILCSLLFFFASPSFWGHKKLDFVDTFSFIRKKKRERTVLFFLLYLFSLFFFILSFGFLSSSLRFSSFCTHITRARCFQFFFSFQVLRLAAIIALLPFVPRPFSVFLAAAVE